MTKSFVYAVYLLFSIITFDAYAEIAVVVNNKAEVDSLSLDEAKEIFLGKVRTFPNGGSAVPILNMGKNIHKKFLMAVVDKNPSQFDSYWNIQQFSGHGLAPRQFQNDEEVKAWISQHADAIGYVNESSVGADEKRVKSVLSVNEG